MAGTDRLDVEDIVRRLLQVRTKKAGAEVQLKEEEILGLCHVSREILQSQPMLLELEAPVRICGDIHGQYYDLLRLFDIVDTGDCRGSICDRGFPPAYNYLFLGDYVDRGKNSLETICLLLAYKILYPENFFLLRGNHEAASINKIYGFYDECKRRYSVKLWKTFTDCFNCLPVAATIDGKIFCCHGGLSPDLESIDSINKLPRPTDVPGRGLLCDLLWSDPDKDTELWGSNDRGVSVTFGEQVVTSFLQQQDFDLICRAHQVVEDGYEFFAKRQLVTIFSAPNYCGEFDNAAAMLSVNEQLMCHFHIIQPIKKKIRYTYSARALEIDNVVTQNVHNSDPENDRDENDGRLQKQKPRNVNQMLQEQKHLQKEKKQEEEQNRKHEEQKNNKHKKHHHEKPDFHHKQTKGHKDLQKEEKKHVKKDQQKQEMKEHHIQEQENMNKGKHLKERKQKQEIFTDQKMHQEQMPQTFLKQSTEERKSSSAHIRIEEEKEDENKTPCILS